MSCFLLCGFKGSTRTIKAESAPNEEAKIRSKNVPGHNKKLGYDQEHFLAKESELGAMRWIQATC